ncbi:hypothetical protein [Microlunatus parietis]|uniref:Uncharacterized protein n=1 Tax=Microlunatus parietis TaxID=682979 RepID=A0A7Y9LCW5_9ACTN|nr:hypothetical protein [Microlunatus parietis]NYE75269.1 hypothetical protein [Microlunatus parietis]
MERCAECGREPEPDEPIWTWSQERLDDGNRTQVLILCPACAREHARSIEAKLDAEWW